MASSTTSTINFVSDVTASGGTLNAGAALDNVQITTAVAAPVMTIPTLGDWQLILLAMAVLLVGLRVRRRAR